MYRLRIKISGEQRRALYEQVRNHLAGLGDVFVALECQKDYPTAERLAIEFGEDSPSACATKRRVVWSTSKRTANRSRRRQ